MRMSFKVILVGGLIVFLAVVVAAVFLPTLVWRPPRTMIAHPYTDQEAAGRKVFYSNGCNYCHTQYVRREDTAMGPVSDGGNYVYDNPMILGSERTGPDLSYIGRKRSEAWEIEHLRDPRQFSPLSLMPSFDFLSDQELQQIVTYLFNLGDRVAEIRMILPPAPYEGKSQAIPSPSADTGSGSQPSGWQLWRDAGLQEGKELYTSHCLSCHGCAGNGLGSYGGTQVATPVSFKQEPYRSMPDDQWFWHVSEGVPGTLMPVWKASLSEDQRWKVIHYAQQIFARPVMRTSRRGGVPGAYQHLTNPTQATTETLEEGKRIFTRECVVCHGDAGRGHGPFQGGLEPPPPDFSSVSYQYFSEDFYFWNISEGVPWTAMPPWKLVYGEEQRWELVRYLRTVFAQADSLPSLSSSQGRYLFPEIYQDMTAPTSASFQRGRATFLERCAHCHGVAGDGSGADGSYLKPPPSNLQLLQYIAPKTDHFPGRLMSMVSFGLRNSAMPSWGEILPMGERYDLLAFLTGAFVDGRSATSSAASGSTLPAQYATLNRAGWTAAHGQPSASHGGVLYAAQCAVCHGKDGGGAAAGSGGASKGPAAFFKSMDSRYVFWRITDGVEDSMMYAFGPVLSESDRWDLGAHVESLLGGGQ
jgi:mono/diheme cytochrome c family protein